MMTRFFGRFRPIGSAVRGSRTTREERGSEVFSSEGVVIVIDVGEKRENTRITGR